LIEVRGGVLMGDFMLVSFGSMIKVGFYFIFLFFLFFVLVLAELSSGCVLMAKPSHG
jgi:hypothetical protein